MSKICKLFAVALFAGLLLFTIRCKKGAEEKAESPETIRDKFISMVKEELRTKGASITYYPKPGSTLRKMKLGPRDARISSFCVPEFLIEVTKFEVAFTSGACGSYSDYKAKIYFTIEDVGSYPPPTDPSQINTTWTIVESGVPSSPNISFSYVGSSGNEYEYVTEEIDFDALGYDFCDVSDISNEMYIPPTDCPSGSTPVVANDGILVQISSFSGCDVVYPFSAQNTGPGMLSYGGVSPFCSAPCNFYPPQEIEFQYRLKGTTTWISDGNQSYALVPHIINGLTPGTYEYRYRHVEPSPNACQGPWSAIAETVVY